MCGKEERREKGEDRRKEIIINKEERMHGGERKQEGGKSNLLSIMYLVPARNLIIDQGVLVNGEMKRKKK